MGSFGGWGWVSEGADPVLQRALHSSPQDFVEVCKREGGDPDKGVDRLLGLGSSRCGAGGAVLGSPRNREGAASWGLAPSAA